MSSADYGLLSVYVCIEIPTRLDFCRWCSACLILFNARPNAAPFEISCEARIQSKSYLSDLGIWLAAYVYH
jgi:hypothetical protein